jgi:hypothetical protein
MVLNYLASSRRQYEMVSEKVGDKLATLQRSQF